MGRLAGHMRFEWARANRHYVYTLADPDTREVRYVGSCHDIKARLRTHLDCIGGAKALSDWLALLKRDGKRPRAIVCAVILGRSGEEAKFSARAVERQMIRWYAIRAENEPLLNVQHNQCYGYTKASQPYRELRKRLIEHKGIRLDVHGWASRLGISRQAMYQRIEKHGEQKAIRMGRKRVPA